MFEEYLHVCDFLSFVDRFITLTCWHSWTEWHILCFTTVTVPPDQWNDMQGDFCTVLLTCCVAAWTDCWLCDIVQKYCCMVTSVGFCRFIQKQMFWDSHSSSLLSLSLSSSSSSSSLLPYFQLIHDLHCRKKNCVQIPHYTSYTVYALLYLWLWLTQLFLKLETFQTKFV